MVSSGIGAAGDGTEAVRPEKADAPVKDPANGDGEDNLSGAGSGQPTPDRRGSALEPGAGQSGADAANIREQQGTSGGGMVPPSFTGEDGPEDAADSAGEPGQDSGDDRG